MPTKQNADLITETAAVLLEAIKQTAEKYSGPDHLKSLAEAFALVAEHDTNSKGSGGRATVLS